MKKSYLIGFILLIFQVGAMAASAFNEENIDRIQMRMPASEVKALFGPADEVDSAVCGGSTKGGSWVCETWRYKITGSPFTNDFVFAVDKNGKLLNSWSVKRAR